jgi:sugar lactone lactonase YvrE
VSTHRLDVVPLPAFGAEDVVVATEGPWEGSVFTGTSDGSIFRVSPDGSSVERVARTGGQPLGLELQADGRLVVCDARRGVLRVDLGSGGVETVADRVDGRPMVFCNNAALAGDGTIWFSDSSARYGIDRWRAEVAEDTRTGRLMRMAQDGTVEVAIDGLSFANGVALSKDESYVVVAETSARTLQRLWLTGERAGARDLFAQDLPGYPDNVSLGTDGLIWVALTSPTNRLVTMLQRGPASLARTASRAPQRLQPQPKNVVLVRAYDDAGQVVHDIDLRTKEFHMVTGVREHNGRLWLGSLEEPAVAVLDLVHAT